MLEAHTKPLQHWRHQPALFQGRCYQRAGESGENDGLVCRNLGSESVVYATFDSSGASVRLAVNTARPYREASSMSS